MNTDDIKKIKIQHENNYRNAIIDNIKNNTEVLVNQDIFSLLGKPPLDSMDFLRTKFLDLAKKNKIVLNTEELGNMLDNYRNFLLSCCSEIKELRIIELSSKVEKEKLKSDDDVIKINKKDFIAINKQIKKIIKDSLNKAFDDYILRNIDSIFINDTDESIKKRIIEDISKYIKNNYQKQIMENCDIKILVKDTTLINGTKEQGERYLFMLNNSRLLQDLDVSS